jgi:hypothetical protein
MSSIKSVTDCFAQRWMIFTRRAISRGSSCSVPKPSWYGCFVSATAGSLSSTIRRATTVGDFAEPASTIAIA